ncbi:MAG: 4-hydroxy-3-methylbut-2-enyl diphosphate reductase [Candidatus Omnitrophica bacterium]|nr:4-hydroxy-3-methylbut-2-enyl diphosphate reductase [Candidatus Omnitrophota bacterium]
MEIHLARTQGFCAGVATAVEIVNRALEKYGTPLCVYHEIVHNTHVVNDFRRRGVVFVEDLSDVPQGSPVIFSAHGIPPPILDEAKQRNLKIVNATCPLVSKVHNEAIKASKKKQHVILLGHKGHQEVIGTAGYVEPELLHIIERRDDIDGLDIDPGQEVSYITQTTLSVDETKDIVAKLKSRFPRLLERSRADICYATQNRQDSVKELARICDLVIICGSPNSSNSNRLRETGANEGVESFIIDKADEFDLNHLKGKEKVGVTSGASVPRFIVDELVGKICAAYPGTKVHAFPDPEKEVMFKLPEL